MAIMPKEMKVVVKTSKMVDELAKMGKDVKELYDLVPGECRWDADLALDRILVRMHSWAKVQSK